MAAKVLYKASKWGSEFHALPHDEALGAGSAGPGKTQCLIHEPLPQIQLEHARCVGDPNLVGPPGHWMHEGVKNHPLEWGESMGWALHLRRTGSTLEQTITRCQRIFKAIDKDVEWVASKGWFIFPSGYHYQFSHCKDLGDWQNFFSNEYSFICFDELSQFDEEQYTQIISRLRVSDPLLRRMLKVRAMSNPQMMLEGGTKVRDPHWVRKRFVDEAPEGRVTLRKDLHMGDGSVEKRTLIYLPAKLTDNPDKDFVRNYEKTLRAMPPHMRRALLDGDWYVTAGAYFAESWIPEIHICKPFKIPSTWKFFRSMDWGLKTPGCVHWYAMDNDENVFVIKELTFKGKDVDWVAAEIQGIEKDLGLWRGKKSLINGWADTQLWEQRGDVGEDKARTMMRMGVRWKPADKSPGSRRSNAQRIIARLEDHENRTRDPGLRIFTNCRQLLKTFPGILTDPDDLEVPHKGGDDHWYDSLSYGVSGASRGLKGIQSIKRERRETEEAPRRKRGAFGY